MANKIKLPKNYMRRLASKGRFGDTELVHVNKDEKELLSNYKGGQLTTNPKTGLKEAFPWLVAGAVAKGLGSLIGGSRARRQARRARRQQKAANLKAYNAAKKRTPEEMQYVQRMQQRSQQGALDVPQLQSDVSRGAWSQARQAQQEQEGQMAMKGMEGSIVADELRRKTDTDTMRMVADQAQKISMANEQTKLQAQGSLDQYQMQRADYLRQIGSQYHQQQGQVEAQYSQQKGQIAQGTWSSLGDAISSGMGAMNQMQIAGANKYGDFANVGDPEKFISGIGDKKSFIDKLSTTELIQFYNWSDKNKTSGSSANLPPTYGDINFRGE